MRGPINETHEYLNKIGGDLDEVERDLDALKAAREDGARTGQNWLLSWKKQDKFFKAES
jgi:hypothetical protein